MDWLSLAFMHSPHLTFPGGATPGIQLALRWAHFIAGITWVGLLYFFVLVNAGFLRELDAPTRMKVVPALMPRALWWFRWSSVVTVVAGIWYWMMIVGADALNYVNGVDGSGAHNISRHAIEGHAIGSFFGLWTIAFVIEMALLMSPAEGLRKGPVFGCIIALVVVGTAWLYLKINVHGWESNRLLAIGIGGGIGWFMFLNVWGIVWRMQKKLIRWTQQSASSGSPMPPEAAKIARLAQLAAQTNFALSFPMLLMMAVASHYPVFGS
ncbi:MAG TPA: urate hydroxylase PuuD [Candidatus Angelobacter sp.]|nr:urate hydroxylase PuuD [Candidatus Angelobacter sp.]